MPDVEFNINEAKNIINNFIRKIVHSANKQGVVLGLSGGLDSATCLYLAVDALNKNSVFPIILPYKESDPVNTEDALELVKKVGVKYKKLDITPIADTYLDSMKVRDKIRRGNFLARIRMAILYDFAKALNCLVMGSGNKTERLIGYTTLWGDMGCDLMPLGDIYKTQVRELASSLNIPEKILKKAPSADLWQGQTDEGELGLKYEDIDGILMMFFDMGWGREWIFAEGYSKEKIERVLQLYRSTEFKRRMPPYPSVTTPEE